jgi:hypothetical protein
MIRDIGSIIQVFGLPVDDFALGRLFWGANTSFFAGNREERAIRAQPGIRH